MEKNQTTNGNKPPVDQNKRISKFNASLPNDDFFEINSGKLKALSDPTRLKILYVLADGELCVCEIISALEKPQSNISHHLNILKNLGLIKGRKEGKWVHYKLAHPQIGENIKELIELI